MNTQAIHHEPYGRYAHVSGPNQLTVLLRAARGDLGRVTVAYADRHEHPKEWRHLPMRLVATDARFDWWRAVIVLNTHRFAYYFTLRSGGREMWYGEGGFSQGEPAIPMWRWNFEYSYAWWDPGDEPPAWAKYAIVYQIFPERFANGDPGNDPPDTLPWGGQPTYNNTFGGDLQGIIDRLDHLSRLGVNCLYLTPVFAAPTNHKYDTADYYRIDPAFGDKETARKLVDECHRRGIRVVLDAVFNHCGSGFPAFQDVKKHGPASCYAQWFNIYNYPVESQGDPNYETFATGIPSMPKLRTDHPDVREYLIRVGEYWTRELNIDGWRLDVGDEVYPGFWREFRQRIKHIRPDALIIGEVMHDAGFWLQGDQMDTVMNYPWQHACVDFFAGPGRDVRHFAETLGRIRMLYRRSVVDTLWNLLDSHDRPRILTALNANRAALKLATLFQFTYPGVPYIYYGTELGMQGGEDPDCRRCMVWDESLWDHGLWEHYRSLIRLRREFPVLSDGEFAELLVGTPAGVYAFARWNADASVLVVMNTSDYPVCLGGCDLLAAAGKSGNEGVLAGVYRLHFVAAGKTGAPEPAGERGTGTGNGNLPGTFQLISPTGQPRPDAGDLPLFEMNRLSAAVYVRGV